jgi:hypothetical protein
VAGVRCIEWTGRVSQPERRAGIHLALVFRMGDGSPAFHVEQGCSADCVVATVTREA